MISIIRRSVLYPSIILLLSIVNASAQTADRVAQATDVIMKLCIAGGTINIKIEKTGKKIDVSGPTDEVSIERKDSFGLVGGISKEITSIEAKQASEVRSCTKSYLKKLVDLIINDAPTAEKRSATANNTVEGLKADPDAFWGGRGFWSDNQNYCKQLLAFVSASAIPENFRYSEKNEDVTLNSITRKATKIAGNYFVRTEIGSTARFCGVFNQGHYFALACSRVVSFDDLPAFASVFNQTLKDVIDCLEPEGWKQISLDQGACIPRGTGGECIRTFSSKEGKYLWLFSNLEKNNSYSVGIQTTLGTP